MKTALTCRHAQRLYGLRRARLFELTDRGVITAVSSESNRKSYRPEAITAAVAYADLRRRGVGRHVREAIAKTINGLPDIVSSVGRGDRYLIAVGERTRKRLVNETEARDLLANLDRLSDAIVVFDVAPIVDALTKAIVAV